MQLKKISTKLLQFSSILFDCIKKELHDILAASQCYLWRNSLQARSFTTPAQYDSARTQLKVEVRKILAFGQVRANENRLCQVFRSQMCAQMQLPAHKCNFRGKWMQLLHFFTEQKLALIITQNLDWWSKIQAGNSALQDKTNLTLRLFHTILLFNEESTAFKIHTIYTSLFYI